MPPKELKLIDGSVIRANLIPQKIGKILWVMDPARVRKIDPRILTEFQQLNRDFELRTAKAQAEIKQAEADLLAGVQKLVG